VKENAMPPSYSNKDEMMALHAKAQRIRDIEAEQARLDMEYQMQEEEYLR
jgi:hypothetical protein